MMVVASDRSFMRSILKAIKRAAVGQARFVARLFGVRLRSMKSGTRTMLIALSLLADIIGVVAAGRAFGWW